MKTIHSTEYYTKLYIQEAVILYGIPVSIISYRGEKFTTPFLKSFKRGLGSKVNFNNIFHP